VSPSRLKEEIVSKQTVVTDQAPPAIGPYSQGVIVEANKLIFCSGQIPLDPETGKLIEGDVTAQTRRALDNLKAVLEAGGSSISQIIKTTVFLKNMGDFQTVNEVYKAYFPSNPPARAAVQVARLPLDADVEIEAIAYLE
jgi:2-iminobutanoate/2-iminopropanoate deaminase